MRDRYLGRKNGLVPALWSGIATAAPDIKRELGRLANELKTYVESELGARKTALETARPAAPRLDLTLPGRPPAIGHRHPLNVVRERVEAIFSRMGYEILDGPETEDDYHNFEALHMPADHPARDMQDTLYLDAPLCPSGLPLSAPIAPIWCARIGQSRVTRATRVRRRCCGRTRPRCRSATWSGISRRCASSRRAGSIAATTST